MRRTTVFGLVLLIAAPAFSLQAPARQSSPTKPPSATASQKSQSSSPKSSVAKWKSYCSEEAEYCIGYPSDWDMVGDVMEGNGVVMAPPQPGKDKSLWDEITVSVTDLPQPENGKEPPSFDEILSVALNGLPGKNVETLQRTQMTIRDRDAELIKVKYDDKETGQPWVEEIVFIDDELAIYSIALRATPQDVEGLEETFRKVVATWRTTDEDTADPAAKPVPEKPKPPATKAPAAKPPSPQ